MKLMRFNFWMGILVLLIVTSCREDQFNEDSKKSTNEAIVLVESTIKGQVVDESNLPIQDVVVNIDGENKLTDENGFFYYEKGDFNKNGTYITANKAGYFLGAKTVNPSLGATSYARFVLLSMDLSGSFNSTAGGDITTDEGAKVSFTPNTIVDANGNSYSGDVDVYVKWINPASSTIGDEMPGDLRAIDSDEENVQLATYGMLAVELRGNSGQELNIANGNTAELTFPLPAELASVAPSSIPLWSFNEDTGYWEEEGTATLQDGKYVGEVSHFSFWNCDAPFPLIELSGKIVNESDVPLSYVYAEITVDGIGTRYGYVNSDGTFGGKVPKDEVLTLVILDFCGNELGSYTYGPYADDTDIGDVVVSGSFVSTISGTLQHCDGTPVTEGYAMIKTNNFVDNAYVDANGDFSTSSILCEELDLTVIGYDIENFLASDPIEISVAESIDLGVIEVCEEIANFVKITVNEPFMAEEYIFEDISGSFDDTYYFYATGVDSTSIEMNINVLATETGTFDVNNAGFSMYGSGPTGFLYSYCNGDCAPSSAEITVNEGILGRVAGVATLEFPGTGGNSMESNVTIEWSYKKE